MYVCIYVYIYIYIYIRVCLFICVFIVMCTYIYIYTYVYTHIHNYNIFTPYLKHNVYVTYRSLSFRLLGCTALDEADVPLAARLCASARGGKQEGVTVLCYTILYYTMIYYIIS